MMRALRSIQPTKYMRMMAMNRYYRVGVGVGVAVAASFDVTHFTGPADFRNFWTLNLPCEKSMWSFDALSCSLSQRYDSCTNGQVSSPCHPTEKRREKKNKNTKRKLNKWQINTIASFEWNRDAFLSTNFNWTHLNAKHKYNLYEVCRRVSKHKIMLLKLKKSHFYHTTISIFTRIRRRSCTAVVGF